MAPSAGDPMNLGVREHVDAQCHGTVFNLKINRLFGLQLVQALMPTSVVGETCDIVQHIQESLIHDPEGLRKVMSDGHDEEGGGKHREGGSHGKSPSKIGVRLARAFDQAKV